MKRSNNQPARLPLWIAAAVSVIAAGAARAEALEEIVVTAQKRDSNLQSTPIAITALTGEALAKARVFSVNDLAASTPALSLMAGSSPVDIELSMRGITNTRNDSPAGEAPVGTFFDEVYIGRNGGINLDFYDIERIEVVRGPQGVLLGKSVIGGALSIITKKPEFEKTAAVTVGIGNYESQLLSGHINSGLSDRWAGRVSYQARKRDGFAYDILHDRELENLDSLQLRAQLLYEPADDDGWGARIIVDYGRDNSNGHNSVPIPDGIGGFQPWSQLRAFLGLTDPRVSAPEHTRYTGDDAPLNQGLSRESVGFTLHLERNFDGMTFKSITAYRDARANNLYAQIGIGGDVLDDREAFPDVTIADFLASSPTAFTLFTEPVREDTDIQAFSQEFRLQSDNDSNFDWIAGVYYKSDDIDKYDRFFAEVPSGFSPGLSGESHWDNRGEITNIAVFGQIGWQISETLKLDVGARWTQDEKKGTVAGIAVSNVDRFNPVDDGVSGVPLTPGGYPATPWGETWTKTTPQATLHYTPSDNLFFYGTISTGFKGGYFQDTAANAIGAAIPINPEEVVNYEVGMKSDFAGGRARFNAAAFFMDYTDLQVEQTNLQCLCNIAENAADAEIVGLEAELKWAATDYLTIDVSGVYYDTEYVEFQELVGVDSSGNRLQRTPESSYSLGLDYEANAWNFQLTYSWQSDLFWEPANNHLEDSYGLLNARVSYSPENAPWSVSVWGKNLSDELYRTNIIPAFGDNISQFGPPLTSGVELSYRFD